MINSLAGCWWVRLRAVSSVPPRCRWELVSIQKVTELFCLRYLQRNEDRDKKWLKPSSAHGACMVIQNRARKPIKRFKHSIAEENTLKLGYTVKQWKREKKQIHTCSKNKEDRTTEYWLKFESCARECYQEHLPTNSHRHCQQPFCERTLVYRHIPVQHSPRQSTDKS